MLRAKHQERDMGYKVTGYSYLHKKRVVKSFADPVDAAVAAIELMGEGDKDVTVLGPDEVIHASPFGTLIPKRGYANA
jgi:hypothetical protein